MSKPLAIVTRRWPEECENRLKELFDVKSRLLAVKLSIKFSGISCINLDLVVGMGSPPKRLLDLA